ncbi:MAG: acetyl-CoA carboxylase carboxyl transferase subunit alpha [Acidobacteria bacterium]|nr:MAG: acetyl-CoA carboxylase carboxyl transferase subunit alpha [Acidobacteriota bacterium]
MATTSYPFLESIEKLRDEVLELELSQVGSSDNSSELDAARNQLDAEIEKVFSDLSRWQRCLLARHPERPYTLAYIHDIFSDFTEMHGDRRFGDDPALIAGFARFDGETVAIVGHQKGRDTAEKVRRNFGMPRPEGYRKALRIMKLAARFKRPIISFIDTPGAYPGIDAEERGQAEAIADNLIEMARLPVPIIVVVAGEGGSGGALALGVGDRVLMLEHSIYSVISPEGCAAILWKDQGKAEEAAQALKLTSENLAEFGVIDEILSEPHGGAHMDPGAMSSTIEDGIRRHLKQLKKLRPEALINRRYKKFRAMGAAADR